MIDQFKPTWMVPAIYDITPDQLNKHGIRAILTDLDNTLIAWNNPDGTPELRRWMYQMHDAGITIVVVSNNSAARVSRAVAPLGLPFVSRALKPGTSGIERARRKGHWSKNEVVMVGDQLITDVWAANRDGVRSILVKPILETDRWNTRFNRHFEKKLWRRLKTAHDDLDWQEDINDRK
ncbi:YqeG family HAD IIIA-type phosphatase [Levilactobacillus bambusae]|uniref:YqeG family HAD IIIA-type phosphatase n=1 Tax=Levilactobacillus bambusae TaxID=2024736 RepID=A0A2V1N3K2_9LACO|nr:YqeG family HAD IIIA-type phosphatase [Levilactobacillus bambusae]PWG01028.1 YqeG family HAD IIIA-type phosphatase [Levilactobacillus bambusae]